MQVKGRMPTPKHHNESDAAAAGEPIVAVAMGSRSDLPTLEPALALLRELAIPYEARVVSAHRTPQWLVEYATGLEGRGIEVAIAAAGGAAHLPGMMASMTLVPVLGVPVEGGTLRGVDALLSIAQMPKGVAVGTLAIGHSGAFNAALLAAQIVSNTRPALRERLRGLRDDRAQQVLADRVIR